MVKKSTQAIILVCILAVIILLIIFVDFDSGSVVEFSINNRIACAQEGFVASLDEEGCVQIVGELSEDFDFTGWENIISIATGMSNIGGVREDHTVVMAGSNYNNKNDVDDWRDIVMVALTPMATFGLKEDGTVVYAGDYKEDGLVDMVRVQEEVGNWRDIVYIDAGTFGVAGVTKNGEVVMVSGMPLLEQEVQKWTDMKTISIESTRIIGIKKNGEVVVCEQTPSDEILTAYPYTDFEGAVKVCTSSDAIACLMPNGTVKIRGGLEKISELTSWERMLFNLDYNSIESAKNIVDIDCSWDYVMALKNNGGILVEY